MSYPYNTNDTDQDPIVRFYDPSLSRPDFRGRTLEAILSWSDKKLEQSHNYIQVLFPLPEGSIFNNQAPLVTLSTISAFHTRKDLRDSLVTAFERILRFYGFQAKSKQPKLEYERAPNFEAAAENWAVPMDHNHLRISRILRSMRILGCAEEAREFLKVLEEVYRGGEYRIGGRSFEFWKRAVRSPLHVAPDDTEVPWLREWEEKKEEEEKK